MPHQDDSEPLGIGGKTQLPKEFELSHTNQPAGSIESTSQKATTLQQIAQRARDQG